MTYVEQAVKEVLERYQRERQERGPLWASAANVIVQAVRTKTPEQAAVELAKLAKRFNTTAVSSFFEGATNTLKTAISKDKHTT